MFPKRFLLTLALLVLTLLALAGGVNAALARLTQSSAQSSVIIYDDKGNALYAYNGNLNGCPITLRPSISLVGPHFLHRT